MQKIDVEKMCDEHILALERIERECFPDPWSDKSFEEELLNGCTVSLTALSDGRVVGYIVAEKVLDEVYISRVAVTKKFRRRGIAAFLLASLEGQVRDASFISLEVRGSNSDAQVLYTKNGYEICGMRKDFYSNPTENAIIMTKYLK